MSICDGCIHDNVCGLEDNHEEGIVSCADMIPKDVLDKIRAEIEQFAKNPDFGDLSLGASCGAMKAIEIINKYKAKSEQVRE